MANEGSIKIATIGGGSSYTPELVEGFIKRYQELPVRELWLVDVQEGREKLEIVGSLAKRMVQEAGVPIDVHLTLDRRAALEGADFVTTQYRAGQLESRINDERISLKHGLIGQETNGAGGLFNALRTIPVALDIVKDMEELCPDAWLINFANPSGIVTEAINRYTNWRKVVGLCNCPVSMRFGIAKWMDVDPDRVRMELSGVNHHFFVTDVFIDGISRFEDVLARYQELSVDELGTMKNIMAIPWSKSLIRGLHAIPVSYLNYYFSTREELEQQLKNYENHGVRAEVVKKIEAELFELYKNPDLKVKPKQLEERGGAHYSDAACSVIDSIYNDKGDTQYVDVRNNGAINNLPAESVIECAAVVTADGPKPLAIGELPVEINGTIQNIKTFERLAAEAAVTGNKDKAIAALVLNPLCDSDEVANQVFDEMLEANRKYLPQFN